MQSRQPDFLSDSHVTVYIQQYLPDTKTPVTVKDLIDYTNTRDIDLIIYKDYLMSNGKSVFLAG